MRAIFLFSLFIISFACSIFFGAEKAYAWGANSQTSTKILNDSLVRNLRCQNLSVNSIYAAIRDDAFDQKRNIPLQNWGFNSGGADIGGCWALSSTQRMFSYMARYNERDAQSSPERTEHVLNMVRRFVPAAVDARVVEFPYRKQAVFLVREDALLESLTVIPGLWSELVEGFQQRLERGGTVDRNFVKDIQSNQALRFFRFSNIPMGVGSGPRSQQENVETIQRLKMNLSGKRLTLLNLRVDQTTQHVVMAKSYKVEANGDIRIQAYDSNQWKKDHEVIYKAQEQQFYAPDILGSLGGNGPLGAFIVSEDEREALESAMLKFYKNECR